MSKFKVKVIGVKPQKRDGLVKRTARGIGSAINALMIRFWFFALAAVAGLILTVGTPHVGWEYGCNHPVKGLGTCRSVSWCAYYGVQGRRVERPGYGERCEVVTMLPVDWNELLGG